MSGFTSKCSDSAVQSLWFYLLNVVPKEDYYPEKVSPLLLTEALRCQNSRIDFFSFWALQMKKAEEAVHLFDKQDLLQKGDMYKSCLLDLCWWQHLANWCVGDGEAALMRLKIAMTLASQLHRHKRFTTAVKVTHLWSLIWHALKLTRASLLVISSEK